MSELERYEVLEKIGQGSFGVINKVRRKSDGLILCRKEISYVKMSVKEREQLQAELSILRDLHHPNIVQYFEKDHLKNTQDLHLYMEYCGNGDLGQVIKRLRGREEHATEEFVWSIFSQVVTALYRCHYGRDPPDVGKNFLTETNSQQIKSKLSQVVIIHRDLKPENVFLTADNSVKLGDFGLSKIMKSHDFASTYVGTPYYMSPEICAAERYTAASDIWSLGCLIYELCAWSPPFNARSHIELFHKIKSGRVSPIPPVYSGELQKAISSCLQVNPSARPTSEQLLSLPVIKVMRKQHEVVLLGKELRLSKANVETEKAAMRSEIDAAVRREWEVRARLEIDRQVKIELDRLQKAFESEVTKRVTALVEERLKSAQTEEDGTRRSSTPSIGGVTCVDEDFQGTLQNEPKGFSELSVAVDVSSLSLDSPPASKLVPHRRSTRTPFTRAHTIYTDNVAPSPMDVQMGEPSPMSIASLALSPRRDAAGNIQSRRASNIFAAAAVTAAEKRWQPTNASTFGNATVSDVEPDTSVDDDDVDEDDIPVLPSPTRDPFKALNKRPSLGRQATLPANTKRMASAPNLFSKNGSIKLNGRRQTSSVPVVATSPSREFSRSPIRTNAPGKAALVTENGSPLRKPSLRDPGIKSKKDDGVFKMAMRNQMQGIHGRTLVELAQARAGGIERERPEKSANIKVAEATVWDPEKDEMPSPFLVRGGRGIRAAGLH